MKFDYYGISDLLTLGKYNNILDHEHGQNVLLYKVAGADHGPGFWNPQVLDITAKFLSAHLNRPH